MSSRQLRKLRQQKELQQQAATHDSDANDATDDEPILSKPRPRANVFSGFAALENDDDANDDDEDDERPEKPDDSQSQPQIADPPKKSKKKAKKKKKAAKQAQLQDAEADEPEEKDEDMDEIDRALQQIDEKEKKSSGTARPTPQSDVDKIASLLSINSTHLKVLNEMRNLFGWETIQSGGTDSDPQAAANGGRGNRGPTEQTVSLEQYLKGRPGQSISNVLLRRNPFVQGKEHWPKASAGGLTMKELGPSERPEDELQDDPFAIEFTFAHDDAYDAVEAEFFGMVQMHDPMMLVHHLHQNPYHVSSLTQVSKVAVRDQNLALSGDLCERALFTFGRVTLSRFRDRLQEGRARLDFRRPENRQFWLASFHYIRSLMSKGTNRTALEWVKLLLSLSPVRDEYAMLCFVHPLAIRAREARWLLALLDNPTFATNMEQNIAECDYIRQTTVLALLQLEDTEGARKRLADGMRSLPWLYCSLFSALNMDTPKAIWGVKPPSGAHEFFTELYIHQTKDLWNNSEATALLKSVAEELRDWRQEKSGGLFSSKPAEAAVPLRLARLVYLIDQPSLMAMVPKEMLHAAPNYDFDPLPPPFTDNVFSSVRQKVPWAANSAAPNEQTAGLEELLHRLALLGDVNARRQGAAAAGAGAQVGFEEEDAELAAAVARDDADLEQAFAGLDAGGGGGGILTRILQMFHGRPAQVENDVPGRDDDDDDDDMPPLIDADDDEPPPARGAPAN